ncbi:hypothetical protein CHLRE_12g540480v5 [Chlamydomonas reinhardtii]|uniref:Uncharacterized protein n=1 Tax=Chlamydomonas reinhardtii TaxID=3055 RepID=A0A2K3D6Y6_CHLRE|nr:uncharacterized protein CHLRE_12g540480v5 [Chlamydomonas reinhardtii]PNW76290.1 hypothetical protein CHLRE_12g540480v5 [Chlamydomonas reinhardtii]
MAVYSRRGPGTPSSSTRPHCAAGVPAGAAGAPAVADAADVPAAAGAGPRGWRTAAAAAVCGEPLGRPLVIGLGGPGCSPDRRGELRVPPASALCAALMRGVMRVRESGRHVLELVDVWEHRTSIC